MLASTMLTACGRKKGKAATLAAGATVLALGDSLTSGVGATEDTSYPTLLARTTSWKVINGGVSGNTSAQALERLPALLAEHHPDLVIVSIGGNDFLRRQSTQALKDNIKSIVQQARATNAQVALVAIPEFSLVAATTGRLSDHALYADLAKELGVPLFTKGWSNVLSDSSLRADEVHANAAGYEKFTNGLVQWLRESGLLG